MANLIPPGAIPKLWRQRNKSGKEVGAWYITVKGKPVNLRTQDYMKARDRAREAYEGGKRQFDDDRYIEQPPPLALLSPIPKETSAPAPLPRPQPANGSDDWTSDVSGAAANGLQPDEVIPPPTKAPPASDSPPSKPPMIDIPTGDKPPPEEDSTKITPEMIDGIIAQAAVMAVELQLLGQEWLAKRALKIQMGPVPEGSKARLIPQKIWEQWLRTMIPEDLPIPPWLAAPLLCAALTVPIQLEGATAIKKEPAKPAT